MESFGDIRHSMSAADKAPKVEVSDELSDVSSDSSSESVANISPKRIKEICGYTGTQRGVPCGKYKPCRHHRELDGQNPPARERVMRKRPPKPVKPEPAKRPHANLKTRRPKKIQMAQVVSPQKERFVVTPARLQLLQQLSEKFELVFDA